ncbi:MAG: hypothetical protein EOP48_01305 [Sphingobacteriales bacterium]|nr:MAG: hypothetical protein EOP48_01305 [Sphingobacteriales bacterium]
MSDNESTSSIDQQIERKPRAKPDKKLPSKPIGNSDKPNKKQVAIESDEGRTPVVSTMETTNTKSDPNAWVTKRKRNISDKRRQQLRDQMHAIRELKNNKAESRRAELEELAKIKEQELKHKMEKEALKIAKSRLQEKKKQTPVVVVAPKKKPKPITVYSSSESEGDDEESDKSDESSSEEEIIIRKKKRKPSQKTIPPPPVLKRHTQQPQRPPVYLC